MVYSPSILSCDVVAADKDALTVSTVMAFITTEQGGWGLTDWRKLTPDDYGQVRLERAVRTYRADGRSVTAREHVFEPKSLDNSAFAIPLEALISAATDDALLMS
jgi:hypothetical protein